MPTFFVTRYDYRAPGASARERQEIYRRSLDQAAYLQDHGPMPIMISEHHCSDDGYLPSPIPVAAALAAVTRDVPITIAALLVNFYEPLRLAEDMAVLDHLTAGRVNYTLGLGYRPEEYAMYGRSWATRGRDIEARIKVMQQAWTGEPFEYEGHTVQVTPTPFSPGGPFCFYGGGTPAAARRAARLGLNFQPQHGDRELKRIYDETCRAQGREPGFVMQVPDGGPAYVFCSPDPEQFWERYGHHLLADAKSYQEWHGEAATFVADHSQTVEEMSKAGVYVVLTPDELIEKCRAKQIRLVSNHAACGGLPAEPSWQSLRLLCETVMPALA